MSIISLLNKLEIKGDLRYYLIDAIEYLIENQTSFLDVNLEGDIYPYLAETYNLNYTTIKTKMIRSLCDHNKETKNLINKYFKVNSKITIKKLIILILLETK